MNDSLGDRMKKYENVTRNKLPIRTHAIIRIDGKAFHSYTKGLKRPYDLTFMLDMDETAKYLCENIMGCKMAYVQSDEISLLLTDYDELGTQPWFDGNIQKMASIAASMATAKFGELRNKRALDMADFPLSKEDFNNFYWGLPQFDARVWSIPDLGEVHNYFVWRQQDATRNSIQMAGQSHFSHKELQGVTCDQIQEKLHVERNINWNDYPVGFKRGRTIVKVTEMVEHNHDWHGSDFEGKPPTYSYRTKWIVEEPPVFTKMPTYVSLQVNKKVFEVEELE